VAYVPKFREGIQIPKKMAGHEKSDLPLLRTTDAFLLALPKLRMQNLSRVHAGHQMGSLWRDYLDLSGLRRYERSRKSVAQGIPRRSKSNAPGDRGVLSGKNRWGTAKRPLGGVFGTHPNLSLLATGTNGSLNSEGDLIVPRELGTWTDRS